MTTPNSIEPTELLRLYREATAQSLTAIAEREALFARLTISDAENARLRQADHEQRGRIATIEYALDTKLEQVRNLTTEVAIREGIIAELRRRIEESGQPIVQSSLWGDFKDWCKLRSYNPVSVLMWFGSLGFILILLFILASGGGSPPDYVTREQALEQNEFLRAQLAEASRTLNAQNAAIEEGFNQRDLRILGLQNERDWLRRMLESRLIAADTLADRQLDIVDRGMDIIDNTSISGSLQQQVNDLEAYRKNHTQQMRLMADDIVDNTNNIAALQDQIDRINAEMPGIFDRINDLEQDVRSNRPRLWLGGYSEFSLPQERVRVYPLQGLIETEGGTLIEYRDRNAVYEIIDGLPVAPNPDYVYEFVNHEVNAVTGLIENVQVVRVVE